MSQKVGSPQQLNWIGDVDKRTGRVRISREAYRFVYDLFKRTGGDDDAVDTALTTAQNAEGAATYELSDRSPFVWNSDPSGVFPAGDPTTDITITFYDADGNSIATRTLRGTLESSTGNISVTNVSSSGLSTTYTLTGDGETSVRAEVTVTLASGKVKTGAIGWSSVDLSAAGGTPSTGGSK